MFGTSRLNVGGNPPRTCGGAIFSDAIRANMRGENPHVPVSLLARYPLLNHWALMFSNIHVWSAIAVLAIIYIQLLRAKGTSTHIFLGRVLKYAILPHFFIVAYILNALAINMPVADWELSPPISDWRAQVAFIIPFACTTTVAAGIGFLKPCPLWLKQLLKALSLFSIVWWFTIGIYMGLSQVTGGLGNFGFAVPAKGDAQAFFAPLNVVLVIMGTVQAGLDWINFKLLKTDLPWIDHHRWGAFVFSYQAINIFAVFVAYFPFCLYGLPEWTCISSPLLSMPVVAVMMYPLFQYFGFAISFATSILKGTRVKQN